MSIELVNSKKESNPPSQLETYVDGQLESARQQVKFTDLISGLLAIACWVLGFLLCGVLVDSWVYQFGPIARAFVFGLLVAGSLWIFWKYVASLFLRRISRLYAARMIELGSDNFHNSLINYLHIKEDGKVDHQMVVHAISQKAAKDLSAITATEKVDRSWMIRLGFGLTGLVFLLVVYTMFSPKSPWPSMARILNPVTQLSAPSVVTISNISPGNATVFFGQKLLITADVKGRHDPDLVRLVFSSEDGQHSEVPIKMTASGTGSSYQVELASSETGIDVPLKYHISAGDGRSPDFNVQVLPTPTIAVKELEIVAPSYTRLPPRKVTGQAEIEGIEGSKVILYAVANMPIKVAYVELLKAKTRRDGDTTYDVVRTVELKKLDDLNAEGQFFLGLDSNRTNQLYTHYQVRFLTEEGVRNQQLNVSPVRVTADLAPEVRIVRPFEKESTLPFNRYLDIEVQASDLDFEISSVQLRLDHEGTRILDHDVDLANNQRQQRVNAHYRFDPRKLQLAVGDKVLFHALARDNRTSQPLGQPDPNNSRTENYSVTIIPPLENELADAREGQPPSDETIDATGDSSNPQANEDSANQPNSDANQSGNSQAQSTNPTGDEHADSNQASNPGTNSDSEIPTQEAKPNENTANPAESNQDSPTNRDSSPDSTDTHQGDKPESKNNDVDRRQTEENDQKQPSQPADNSESKSSDSEQKSKGSPEKSNNSKQGNRGNDPPEKGGDKSGSPEINQGNQGNSKPEKSPNPNSSDSPQDQRQPQTGDASSRDKTQNREGSDNRDAGKGQNTKQESSGGSNSKESQNANKAPSETEKSSGENGNRNSEPSNSKSEGSGENAQPQNNSGDPNSSQGRQAESPNSSTGDTTSNSAMDESATDADRFERLRELVEEMNRKNDSKGQPPSNPEKQESTEKEPADQPNSADPQGDSSPNKSNQNTSNAKQGSPDNPSPGNQSDQKQDSNSSGDNDSTQKANNSHSKPDSNQQTSNDSQENSKQKQGSNQGDSNTASSNQKSDSKEDTPPTNSQTNQPNSDQKQPENAGNASQQTGNQQTGNKSSDQKSPGDQQPSDQQPGDGQSGNGEKSDKSPDESPDKSPGDSAGNSGGDKPADESTSQQAGSKNSNEKSGQPSGQGNSNSAKATGGEKASNNGQVGSGSSNGPGSDSAAPASQNNRKSSDKADSPNSTGTNRPVDENSQRSSGSVNSKQLSNGTLTGDRQGDMPDNADPSEGDLTYAQEATDLILDHLRNQANNPDPKLLEQMNWTEQDLRDFLARWEEMKSKAKSSSAVERRRYDDALRSLNLRPESVRRNVLKSQRDKLNKLTEDGAVNRPPPELADEFNSFLKNRNRVDKSK